MATEADLVRTEGAIGAALRSRRPRIGPENDLVERFLDRMEFRSVGGQRVTVFREPKLQSGFPDVVAVRWREATTERWHESRATLVEDELRLLHFLTLEGASDEGELKRRNFGRVTFALDRLAAVGLVRNVGGRWRAAPLHAAFAVRSIISFEAKISSWTAAVSQAALNRWFASESYVLVPQGAAIEGLVGAAIRFGVGVWIEGSRRPALPASRSDVRQPVSYASWLFNEWSWRESLQDAQGRRDR